LQLLLQLLHTALRLRQPLLQVLLLRQRVCELRGAARLCRLCVRHPLLQRLKVVLQRLSMQLPLLQLVLTLLQLLLQLLRPLLLLVGVVLLLRLRWASDLMRGIGASSV
jgi:hypothetical protein